MAKTVLLDDQLKGHIRHYKDLITVITVYDCNDIESAFAALSDYQAKGCYLAGYAAYELGFCFETKLKKQYDKSYTQPLLQMGVFKHYSRETPPSFSAPDPAPYIPLKRLWSEAEYLKRFNAVQNYIQSGDVYQVNLTFPMTGTFSGEPLGLYAALRRRQPVHYGGVVSLDEGPDIISLSPELFFEKRGREISMRPMKGTIKRLADAASDKVQRHSMQEDKKSRAENLMIVDLLRNDLSRISVPGTVKVPELFALETYPTLHQMTSQVTAKLGRDASIKSLFESLFPCGSVTGAPKIRAMEIIRELEDAPRGAYCGALGYIDPDGRACFNVGIRTLILEGETLTYNVGSGVVSDSAGADEYNECLLKAAVITKAASDLIETMRQEADGSIALWPYHMARLKQSAKMLGYSFSGEIIEKAIPRAQNKVMRLRLTLSAAGEVVCESTPLKVKSQAMKLVLSQNPLDLSVQETRHKVTARDFYDGERGRIQALCSVDEVLFFNPEGRLCEGSFTSLFIKKDGKYLTPPLSDGLLPGVLREKMLESGEAIEHVLTADDLKTADIYIGNALRGLMKAELIIQTPL